MRNYIDGRLINELNLSRMRNCRLATTHKLLNDLLMLTEKEIEERSGKGGGGLK
jgi:hypothetical protein